MQDNEDLIRRRAHQIWEEQGQPEGQDEAHWHQAAEELGHLSEAEAADVAAPDFTADDRRRDEEGQPDQPPLTTTRQSAAFRMANSKPAAKV